MSPTTSDSARLPVATIHELQHAARQYRIITGEEIIQRTGEQIVRACQLQISAGAWQQNFNLVADDLSHWCQARAGRVLAGLVAVRSDKVVFYVVPQSEAYDFDLGAEQAELDITLNTRGGIGYVETRQIPWWEMQRFVPSDVYRVWPTDDGQ